LTSERDAAIAQAQQHDRQREAIEQEIAPFDAEAAIAQELCSPAVRFGSGVLQAEGTVWSRTGTSTTARA
jgi:hypothetical protein